MENLIPQHWREVPVSVAPGLVVRVLEAADPERVLADAVESGSDPYAAIVWPAALAAAAELARHIRPGERVLDLGAGTGLCALTAARVGAQATALDHDPSAVELIRRAAALQGLQVTIQRFDLAGPGELPPCDVAVLADVLYERPLAQTAARRALEVLRRGGRVLVADPDRVGREDFVAALNAAGVEPRFQDRWVQPPGEPRQARVSVAWLPADNERPDPP